MHVHIPKPLHGWREFVGEVGIIVIGVLIALGAEYLIERWHWHEQTDHARETIKDEIYDATLNAWERLAVAGCLQSHLVKLANSLDKSDGRWVGMPMPRHETSTSMIAHITPAYAAPSRVYLADAWKNALSSGILNHMPNADIDSYSFVFADMETLGAMQETEASMASKLTPLSFDRHLSDRDRADMIATIAEVDRALSLINVVSGQMVKKVREMKLGFDPEKVKADRAKLLQGQRAYRGACVQAVPLDLG